MVSVHTDNDLSAYKGKRRPGFEALLTQIHSRAIDVVICYNTDRLYRNRKDTFRFLETATAASVSVYVEKGPDLDLSSAHGQMVADILASVTREETHLVTPLPAPASSRVRCWTRIIKRDR